MRRLMGRSMKSCVEIVEAELGRKLPDDFVETLQADTYAGFPRCAAAGRGRRHRGDRCDRRRQGIATCVASSGSLDKMRVTLGITGLWERFEGRIFSSSQVPRGKPFPDLFLHAAIQMNEQPFACTVVEDSLPGIQAARVRRHARARLCRRALCRSARR